MEDWRPRCFFWEREGGERDEHENRIDKALNEINTQVEAWRPRGKIDTKTGRNEIYNTPVKKKTYTHDEPCMALNHDVPLLQQMTVSLPSTL